MSHARSVFWFTSNWNFGKQWRNIHLHSTTTCQQKMSLCGLPPELIAVILDTLTIPELLRCKQARPCSNSQSFMLLRRHQVCKQFSCIIEDVKFQYKIELAVSGMQDSPPNQVESAERLDMLRRQQEAWHAFQWNIYAFPTDTRSVDISGCVLLETTVNSDSSIKLTRAPSAHRRINDAGPSEWSLDNLGIILDTWIIDPSQDLLIATEIIKEFVASEYLHLSKLTLLFNTERPTINSYFCRAIYISDLCWLVILTRKS